VAANSLVLKDVPPGQLASGVPAQVVGSARDRPSVRLVPTVAARPS
jgi:serine acetyltransferase